MMQNNWTIFRQDFVGMEYVVKSGLTEAAARQLVREFESHGHHQHYWTTKSPTKMGFDDLLKTQLANGSSLSCSIRVLQNQGATVENCVDAIEGMGLKSKKEAEIFVMALLYPL